VTYIINLSDDKLLTYIYNSKCAKVKSRFRTILYLLNLFKKKI
jgi:hypothetical protein